MMCAYPKIMKVKTKKENGGEIKEILIPCRTCLLCRLQHAREWTIRFESDIRDFYNTAFITLTYNNENLPENKTLIKKDLQDFIKRVRYYIKKIYPKRKIKYLACGEYGDSKERPHYHILIDGICGWDVWTKDKKRRIDCSFDMKNIILKAWNKGIVKVGQASKKSIRYVCGYIDKKYGKEKNKKIYEDTNRIPPFKLQSMGIGKKYVYENINNLIKQKCMNYQGLKLSMPRYFIKIIKKSFLGSIETVKDGLNWLGELKRISDLKIDKQIRESIKEITGKELYQLELEKGIYYPQHRLITPTSIFEKQYETYLNIIAKAQQKLRDAIITMNKKHKKRKNYLEYETEELLLDG